MILRSLLSMLDKPEATSQNTKQNTDEAIGRRWLFLFLIPASFRVRGADLVLPPRGDDDSRCTGRYAGVRDRDSMACI
jgi:hypothetical protein